MSNATHPSTTDQPITLEQLAARVAALEARLSPSPDWRPDEGNLAQAFLWERGRVDAPGPDFGKLAREEPFEVMGFPLMDLARGTLRPSSLAQVIDCLHLIAHEVAVLMNEAEADLRPPDDGGLFALDSAGEDEKAKVDQLLAAAYGARLMPGVRFAATD